MAKGNTSRAAITALCNQFIARSIAQGMKGKTRDRAALEFVLGAATLADCIGDKALYSPLAFLGLMVAARGFEEVKRRAEDQPTSDETAANNLAPQEAPAVQFDVLTVIAVCTKRGAYGIGATHAEAIRNMQRESRLATADVLRFYSCKRDALTIMAGVDLQINAPRGSYCGRLEIRS